MNNLSNKRHWEDIFANKENRETSWFQPYPTTSVNFLELFQLPLTANIIDIGAGDSYLVDVLLDKGYSNIWVLDISANALERTKKRLGGRTEKVHWIVADVTEFIPPVQFDLWHDRAAFHFLTNDEAVNKYVSIAEKGVKQSGYLVLGTFSDKGPTKCSGLEIKRYNQSSMSARFEAAFRRIKCITENHTTPFDTIQNFLFCSFQRKRSV